MLARHPLTGKDIRILNMDTSIWREKKTLAWFDEAPANSERLNRWDIGATSVAAATALATAGLAPDIVLCLGPDELCAAWCAKYGAKPRIVAIRQSLVAHVGMEAFAKLGLGNVICLEEIHDMYPFVGAAWNGSVEDAKVLLAMVLQFGLTFPVEHASRPLRGLRIQSSKSVPEPLWFITQYYKAPSSSRKAEIDSCLQANLECPIIDKVVLLNETACAPQHPKIQEDLIGRRINYADVIRWIVEKAPRDVLIVFANADIFLDAESWRALWSTDLEQVPKFLALLRWDVSSVEALDAKLFGPRADSQDTWVVSSNAVKAQSWDWEALNFPFGQGGCDNAITIEMFKKKFLVANPALTLKTYHLHSTGIRSYDPRRVVEKPAFLYIQPTGLHDKKPIYVLPGAQEFSFKPFERRIKGPLSSAQAKTFCAMVKRSTNDQIVLEADSTNLWSPRPVPLVRTTDTFYTRDGLAYTYDTLLVGKTKAAVEAWSKSKVSYLAASLLIDDAMIAPLSDQVAADPSRYVLEYLSKVFLLQQHYGSVSGEFWCSRKPACSETLRMFNWPVKDIPVISRDENQQTWCSSAAIWPYQDIPAECVSREEVGALRFAFGLGGWVPSVQEKQLIMCVDDKWLTQEIAETIEKEIGQYLKVRLVWSETSLQESLMLLRGAWGILTGSKSAQAAWSWILPKGAFVWEIQSEMEPTITLLHLAAAAEMEHRMTIVPKGIPMEKDRVALTTKLVEAISAEFRPAPQVKLDLLLPSGHTGFFAHAGDSFREIAQEWGRRGYVSVKPSKCTNIWLGGMGETLLYDRPTKEWLVKCPLEETTWKKALFGNPAPGPKGTSWTFWPRRPLLVESLVEKGTGLKSWEDRHKTLVFYGRSENSVQLGHRRRSNWTAVCDEFVHVEGLKPYPYTHTEYLERLAESRFGLCLAGYGFKCHREIECMAMGCVPVAGPDVDMTHYAEPPVEGLHYLRVDGAQRVKETLEKITPDRWMVMSVACRDWWKRNCSVDGMWALTQALARP